MRALAVLAVLAPFAIAACASNPEPSVDPAKPPASAPSPPRPAVIAIHKTSFRIDPKDTFIGQFAPDCLWAAKQDCKPGEHCGPPPPIHVACPDEKGPKGKETWFRFPARFRSKENGCVFSTDRLCPQPKLGGGACTESEDIELSCEPAPGKPGMTRVPAFRYKDAADECMEHEESTCPDGSCDPLPTKKVPCR